MRRLVGWIAVGAVLAGGLGCRGSGDGGASRSGDARGEGRAADEAELREILGVLADLIRRSDAATSAVTVVLKDGATAEGRVARARTLEPERSPELPALADSLGAVSRVVPIMPRSPGGMDWAPGSTSEILVAREGGVWRVNVDTGARSLWLGLPADFVPRQVSAGPSGRVLLAQPGRAGVAEWDADGETSVTLAPEGFRLNYAAWNAAGSPGDRHPVVGILEYLQFTSPEERIHLEAGRWSPESGKTGRYTGPSTSDLAWLGSSWEMGCWLGLRRRAGQIDPFPGALLYWNVKGPSWAPLLPEGEWTDAGASFSRAAGFRVSLETGEFVGSWVRRLRPNRTAGRPWVRWRGSSGGESGFEDVPLSESNVEAIRISPDGRRVVYVPARGGTADAGLTVRVAEVSEAVAASRHADLATRERRRQEARKEMATRLREAWEKSQGAGAAKPGQSDSKSGISENLARMDAAFASAAEAALGVRADHTIASLAEIDAGLDCLGGDNGSEPGLVVGLGAYFGETLRRRGVAEWSVGSWPPDLDTTEAELSSSDEFLYTTHRPFLAAREAFDKGVSLEATARELLVSWSRPLWLIDRDHAPGLAEIVIEEIASHPVSGLEAGSDPRTAALTSARVEAWLKSPPGSDWALLRLLGNEGLGEYPCARWRLAAELAGRHCDSARAFGILGDTLGEEGFVDAARVCLMRAFEMDPREAAYAVGAGMAAFHGGDYEAASTWLRRARAIDRDGEWRDTITEALEALQDVK